MNANWAQCIGAFPLLGFVVGCILLGMGLISLCGYMVNMISNWYTNTDYYARKEHRKELREQAKIQNRPLDYWEKRNKRKAILERIVEVLRIVFGIGIGLWILWGFFSAVKCWLEN